MKKEMIRASIYIEKQVWQGMREAAHDRWVSIGKYLTEAHNEFNKVDKVNKVNKPQVPEKIVEMQMPEKPESTSHTEETPKLVEKAIKLKAEKDTSKIGYSKSHQVRR